MVKFLRQKTGEISIRTSELTLLAKSIRPLPIVKEKDGVKYDSFSDKEQRYRTHLDLLLNPEVKNIFIKRTKIIQFVRTFLDEHKFLEVERLLSCSQFMAEQMLRPFITHHNTLDQKLYKCIADELYLKRLIIGV